MLGGTSFGSPENRLQFPCHLHIDIVPVSFLAPQSHLSGVLAQPIWAPSREPLTRWVTRIQLG
jgi:hypothetical protein